jgi:SAM-dependent methyltransferase
MHSAPTTPSEPFPLPLLCPNCLAMRLQQVADDRLYCATCERHYEREEGFYNLVIGDRFEDATDEECLRYEEVSNSFTAENYWLPKIDALTRDRKGDRRVLALGCGTGIEVDVLNAAGIECVGIDCGNRPRAWCQRTHTNHFLLANGMRLPFDSGMFDVVFCGCVFPHVGVEGDTFVTTNHTDADRMRLASEMSRVLRPGGHIIASSPNRRFPLDLFHGREAGSYIPRINRPGDRFLLSSADYRSLFRSAGCDGFRCLTSEGYWGFVRSKNSLKGAVLGMPVRAAFWTTSRESAPFLRDSFIAPWLVVQAQKQR